MQVSGALANLGLVSIEKEQLEDAAKYLTESIHSFSTISDRLGICECLEAFANLSTRQNKARKAAVSFFPRSPFLLNVL